MNFDLDPLIPSSFSPICLLPTISKMTEKVVHIQLLQHLESTNQIHRDHHTYQEKLNTSSALLQITDIIYRATDMNRITSSMSMDMSLAFNCVRHDLMMQKLPNYNIGQGTCSWIQSYLDYRSHYVEIGDKSSVITRVETGVPQILRAPKYSTVQYNIIQYSFLQYSTVTGEEDGVSVVPV